MRAPINPPPPARYFFLLAKLLRSFPERVVSGICMEILFFYHYHPTIATDLRYLPPEYVSFLFLQKFRRTKE